MLPASWQRGQCAAVTTCVFGYACNADRRDSRKGRAVQRSRLGRKTGRRGCWCRLAGQTGNEPPCSDYAQRSRENGRRADSMRCCCGSSIRHRPKYGREREKSLPVGGACGQRSRPLCCRGKIKEKPYGKFFSLRRRHWPGGNGGPAGFVRRCVVFRVVRDGFCWRQNLLCGDRRRKALRLAMVFQPEIPAYLQCWCFTGGLYADSSRRDSRIGCGIFLVCRCLADVGGNRSGLDLLRTGPLCISRKFRKTCRVFGIRPMKSRPGHPRIHDKAGRSADLGRGGIAHTWSWECRLGGKRKHGILSR